SKPIVTLTPEQFVLGQYRVSGVTATGFTIETSEVQQTPITFAWHAFAKVGLGFETASAVGSDSSASPAVADTEPPLITLYGNNPATITVGSSYVDLGAHVTDNVSQNMNLLVTDDQIVTSVPGTYEVKYNAQDAAGNAAVEVIRTVQVVSDEPAPAPAQEPVASSTPPASETNPS
ncbi:MAG: immunoglobulin-like domain-containing protein, partial [Patescibacteria group bacterium]